MAAFRAAYEGKCRLCLKAIIAGQNVEMWPKGANAGEVVHESCASRRRYIERCEEEEESDDACMSASEKMDYGLSEVHIPIMADYPHKPNSGG